MSMSKGALFTSAINSLSGVWQGHMGEKSHKFTQIKVQNRFWTTGDPRNITLHNLTIYVTPGKHDKAKFFIYLMRWIVSQKIQKSDP